MSVLYSSSLKLQRRVWYNPFAMNRREFLGLIFKTGAVASVDRLGFLPKEREQLEQSTLMFHEVSKNGFKQEILNRMEKGDQPISLETLVGALRGEIYIPQNTDIFHITLDDGRKSQLGAIEVVSEIQRETGVFVPLTFFVLTKFQDLPMDIADIPENTPSYNDRMQRYMTKKDILDIIEAGHQIHNHTVNHANLSALPRGVAESEIVTGEERIQALWDLAGKSRDYKAFAYPYGNFNQNVLEIVSAIGYDVGFSTTQTTQNRSHEHLTMRRVGRT